MSKPQVDGQTDRLARQLLLAVVPNLLGRSSQAKLRGWVKCPE